MTNPESSAPPPSMIRRLAVGSAIAAAGLLGVLTGCSSSGPGSTPGTSGTSVETTATTTVTTQPEDQTRTSTTRTPNVDGDSGGANGYTPGGGDLRNEDDPLSGS